MATAPTTTSQTPAASNPFTAAASSFTPTLGKLAGQEQTLASWAAPYFTDMLGKGQGLTETPYQTYQGPLTAGQSDLQGQAFKGLGSLSTPSAVSDAASAAGRATNLAEKMGYSPTAFTGGFTAPGAYTALGATNPYEGVGAFDAGKFDAGYNAQAGAYSPVGQSFTEQGVAQRYMNPFTQQALDPTLAEIRRQSDISRMADAARLSQAGAYGGSRQAIMESEGRRNLLDQLARTTGTGYETAYNRAADQFNQEQQRRIQEAQFGSQQGMASADAAARYAMAAQQAREQSRQFGAQQGMQGAQNRAQFGLDALRLGEQSRQFGAQQGLQSADMAARYGLDAQRAAEQSKQFGAGYGLDALSRMLTGAQVQGQLGASQAAEQRANLSQMLEGGAQQRAIEQQGVEADREEFERQRMFPYEQLKFQQALMQNTPIAATNYTYDEPSGFSQLLTGAGGLKALYDSLFGNQPTTPAKP